VAVLDAVEARKRGDFKALVDLLADTDYRTRWAAAQQLGRLGDPAAVPPLLRTLHSADDGLRVSAIKSLAMIGDSAAVPALAEVASHDTASGVRVTAVDALAALGDPRGIDMLVTRRWALKRLRELRAAEALTQLEAAPRARSLRTRLALARTRRALRGS